MTRLEIFIDAWQDAISRRDFGDLSPDLTTALGAPLNAESLADAHALAWEALARLRDLDPGMSDRVRKVAFAVYRKDR